MRAHRSKCCTQSFCEAFGTHVELHSAAELRGHLVEHNQAPWDPYRRAARLCHGHGLGVGLLIRVGGDEGRERGEVRLDGGKARERRQVHLETARVVQLWWGEGPRGAREHKRAQAVDRRRAP